MNNIPIQNLENVMDTEKGISRHLQNEVVEGISPGVVESSLASVVVTEDRLTCMTDAEWDVLVVLNREFRWAHWKLFEHAAQICEKYSDGEDAIGGLALMLYVEACRRAPRN